MNERDTSYRRLLEGNKKWVRRVIDADPEFFSRLAHGQQPFLLWIGCADSRVPANEIVDAVPGEVFVHRNIANLFVHTDMNALSVLEYAVNHLHVDHVIVCGHYGCGGVRAAMSAKHHGMIDNWLRHIKDVYRLHQAELEAIADEGLRERRLVELNVIEQVYNVCKTSIVQESWQKTQLPQVHGWVYDVANGLVRDLEVNFSGLDEMAEIYEFEPRGA
ncbi:MAG: carbonic anhydrase [Candidatus Xenobia bacterium]|jgi:carbonic anhydrase